MRSAIIVACVLSSFASLSPGQTVVGGNMTSNTSWSLAGHPYIVTSDLTVRNGATLTIDPGVTVLFNSGIALRIGQNASPGVLDAQGTAGAPIIFSANQVGAPAGFWEGIELNTTTSASTLDHCVIEKAGQFGTAIVEVKSASPTISNCMIRDSSFAGIDSSLGAHPHIVGNTISNCSGRPVRIALDSFPQSLTGNSYANNGTNAIELAGGTAIDDVTLLDDGLPYDVTTSIIVAGTGAFRENLHAIGFALLTGLSIASYSLLGGLGVRESGTVLGYAAWLELLSCAPFIAFALVRRRHFVVPYVSSKVASRNLVLGFGSVLAYLIVLWAMTLLPLATVTATQETSAIFAALAGTILMKEPFAGRRIIAAGFVTIGITLLVLG